MLRLSILLLATILLSCENSSFDSLNNQLTESESYQQKTNEVLYDIGSGYISDIKNDISSTKNSPDNKTKISKISYLLDRMIAIDTESKNFIRFIDSLKITLLKNAKEDYKFHKNTPKIVLNNSLENTSSLPTRFDLTKLKEKKNGEVVSDLFVKNSEPNKNGSDLWNYLINYRKRIVTISGSYEWSETKFDVTPSAINHFEDKKQLIEQVETMIDTNNANLKEDRQVLIDLYVLLTKNETSKNGNHWMSEHFGNTTIIGAFNILSSLQYDILTARRLALAHWKSRVNSCGYGFTSILPLTKGPSTAFANEDFDLTVFMGAFDEENQPRVTIESADTEINYPMDGTGRIKLNLKEGLHHLSGTVSIKNKSGIEKVENWEWMVNVIEKAD